MSSETTSLRFQPASIARRTRRAMPLVGRWSRERASRWGRSLVDGVRGGRWAEFGLIAAVLVSLVLVRAKLGPWASADYNQFLAHWFEYLQLHGFQGLGDEFANYNVPYLYLLYVGTLVHADGLGTVKVVGALSDLVLALGCVGVMRRLHVPRELALFGGAVVLLLPEVLLNSAGWGQADSTYCGLLVWAIWAATGGRRQLTWVLFALAFTFKLQAAFVLPAFIVLHVTRRWGWRGPALALVTVLATEVPALIAGRSLASLASIYLNQVNDLATLTMNAPSLYALLPEANRDVLKPAGMFFALASVALLTFLLLRAARRRPLDSTAFLLFVAALATLAPYTLPTMHERYFYVGNVLLLLAAIANRRLLPWALVAQLIAVSAYSPYLLGTGPVVSMGLLAVAEGVVLYVVVRELGRTAGVSLPAPAPVAERAASVPITVPMERR